MQFASNAHSLTRTLSFVPTTLQVLPRVLGGTAIRYASVLSSIPPRSLVELNYPLNPLSSPIAGNVTATDAPLTAPSNNMFTNMPKGAKARLTLNELKEMMELSKEVVEFLEKSALQDREEDKKLRDSMDEFIREQKDFNKTVKDWMDGKLASKSEGKK